MNTLKKYASYLPGFFVTLVIAFAASAIAEKLEVLIGIHLIGASVIAIFIGMIINHFWKPSEKIQVGLKFTSKKILKFAIILLGLSLNIHDILKVGGQSLLVMIFTLFTCFGVGYFVGKALGLNWKLSNLISAGTGICGGSAIASISPVIDADDSDVAYAMSATFLFDMAMILLFPIMGRALNMADNPFGLWSGTAVNDTSSVVAASYAFSEKAGDFAVMVKLTRTLAIIPTVVIFALISVHLKKKAAQKSGVASAAKVKVNFLSLFPWFIVGFVALALVNSFVNIPTGVCTGAKSLSKFLMVAALAAIGLNTNFSDMKKSGIKPMIHGFIISALVVIVAIAVIWFEQSMGLMIK